MRSRTSLRPRTKAALVVAAVALIATAGFAWANTTGGITGTSQGVSAYLFVAPSEGYYGQDIMLMPQVNTETKVSPGPGLRADKFEFQVNNNGKWEKFEDQLVEETGTVDPLMLVFDDSLTYPAEIRALFYRSSRDATGVVGYELLATSEPVTIDRLRHIASRVSIVAPNKAESGKAFTTSYVVKPLSGIGKVKVTVAREFRGRFIPVTTKMLTTDEMGEADLRISLSRPGTYRITASFAGNAWAGASPNANRFVTVR